MYTDIHKLTDQILASFENEDRIKSASDANVDPMHTDIGKQLKKVASQLRETSSSADITYDDLLQKSAVKTAAVVLPESPIFGKTALSRSLREVAATLRRDGLEKSAQKHENSARILRAA